MKAQNVGKWHYIGDTNIEHGGVFISLEDWQWGYCEAVRVDDVDGCNVIKHVTIHGMDDAKRIKAALQYCGQTEDDLAKIEDEEQRKLWTAYALLSYGYFEPADDGCDEWVQTDPSWQRFRNGDCPAKVKYLRGGELEEYVVSVHLHEKVTKVRRKR